MRPMMVRATASACRPFAVLTAILLCLAVSPAAQASTLAWAATPAQNITASSATLEGIALCAAGGTCHASFQYEKTGGTWQSTPSVSFTCNSSLTCRWYPAAPVTGLAASTGYDFQLCRDTLLKGPVCLGPDGTSATTEPFTTAAAAASTAPAGSLTFNGNFANGVTPWKTGGGGVQCANYGTPSKYPRLRGDFYIDQNVAGQPYAGQFALPTDTNPTTYPLEACDLLTAGNPIGLGTDGYYGISFYVPSGWTIANSAFYGVEFMEYHFQNIDGAPVSFQLHPDHVTLALELGACANYTTASPGCQYRSNADSGCWSNGSFKCLPAQYAIPRGALVEGAWNEILMHVHWASDGTGQIQTWYRIKGSPTWTASASLSGVPTVQWNQATGCCASMYTDETEAYTGALTSPLSLYIGNQVAGTGFGAVAAAMP